MSKKLIALAAAAALGLPAGAEGLPQTTNKTDSTVNNIESVLKMNGVMNEYNFHGLKFKITTYCTGFDFSGVDSVEVELTGGSRKKAEEIYGSGVDMILRDMGKDIKEKLNNYNEFYFPEQIEYKDGMRVKHGDQKLRNVFEQTAHEKFYRYVKEKFNDSKETNEIFGCVTSIGILLAGILTYCKSCKNKTNKNIDKEVVLTNINSVINEIMSIRSKIKNQNDDTSIGLRVASNSLLVSVENLYNELLGTKLKNNKSKKKSLDPEGGSYSFINSQNSISLYGVIGEIQMLMKEEGVDTEIANKFRELIAEICELNRVTNEYMSYNILDT